MERRGLEQHVILECIACGANRRGLLRCSGCKSTFYCSVECQKRHWKHHKSTCSDLQETPFVLYFQPMSPAQAPDRRRPIHTAIIGGGLIGLCSAWFALSRHILPRGSTVTIIENSRSGLHNGSSSRGRGFLVGGEGAELDEKSNWLKRSSRSLAKLSWDTHVELATLFFNGAEQYDWRKCVAIGLKVGGKADRKTFRDLPVGWQTYREADWLDGHTEILASDGVGQLDPALFCQCLVSSLTKLGCRFIYGDIISMLPKRPGVKGRDLVIDIRPNGPAEGFTRRTTLLYQKILVAAGPWSKVVCEKLDLPAIPLSNQPEHGFLMSPSLSSGGFDEEEGDLPSEAIFADITSEPLDPKSPAANHARRLTKAEIRLGYTVHPDVMPRADGLVYVGGEHSIPATVLKGKFQNDVGRLPNRLPERVDGVAKLRDVKLLERLLRAAEIVSPTLTPSYGANVQDAYLCYRSITPDGEPIICKLQEHVYLATGHGLWGTALAPGTGKVISELMFQGRAVSADISKLGLDRFSSLVEGGVETNGSK